MILLCILYMYARVCMKKIFICKAQRNRERNLDLIVAARLDCANKIIERALILALSAANEGVNFYHPLIAYV